MLVEFRVANFRSIRDEQCLSMVASAAIKEHLEHRVTNVASATPDLLKTAVIYGANASGKSNLINAMAFFRAMVNDSATLVKEGQTLNCTSFKLDKNLSEQPSMFEIVFVHEGVRYQYGFKLTPQYIAEEWLLVYKAAKPQQWFNRKRDANGKHQYKFSSYLTGPRSTWEEATRDNALFLSTAVQLNSELLRPIFLWITQALVIFGSGALPPQEFTTLMLQDSNQKEKISRFLRTADFGIDEIELDMKHGFQQTLHFDLETGNAQALREEKDMQVPIFIHRSAQGSARFDMHEESEGTQKVFRLSGAVFDVLKNGRTFIVDELDSSLHPLMMRHLLELFHGADTSNKQAQLIFTTHDTTLLDVDILRRDQIWFIEKDVDHSSRLYPLSDFNPRNKEALEKGYLSGRYGAIPFFSQEITN